MCSGVASVFWIEVVARQPKGWWAVLKECSQQAKTVGVGKREKSHWINSLLKEELAMDENGWST